MHATVMARGPRKSVAVSSSGRPENVPGDTTQLLESQCTSILSVKSHYLEDLQETREFSEIGAWRRHAYRHRHIAHNGAQT